MKTSSIACAVVLSLAASGAALAQAPTPAPAANTGRPSSGTMTGSSNPALNKTGNAPSSVNASGKAEILQLSALEKGRNSFTRGQATKRLAGAGFTQITDLKKDDQGIWRGKAMMDGASRAVGFDYKGNIGAQ